MRASLLVICLAWLALAGCAKSPPTIEEAHADLTAKIDTAITDPARAQRVSAMAGQLLDEQQSMAVDLKSTVDRLAALNADFNASADQYTALYKEYQSRRKTAQLKFKEGIFAVRKQVSAEEWKHITK